MNHPPSKKPLTNFSPATKISVIESLAHDPSVLVETGRKCDPANLSPLRGHEPFAQHCDDLAVQLASRFCLLPIDQTAATTLCVLIDMLRSLKPSDLGSKRYRSSQNSIAWLGTIACR